MISCFKGDASIGTDILGKPITFPSVEMSPYTLRISNEIEKAYKERGSPVIADGHDKQWQYEDGKALIVVDVYRVDRISGEVYRIEKGEMPHDAKSLIDRMSKMRG